MNVLRGAGPVDDAGSGSVSHASGRNASGRDVPGAAYDTRWLDLRARADDRARSADLLRRLLGSVGTFGRRGLHLLDLGCGAGAMQRWCAEQLPGPARWTLLDPDPGLLQVALTRSRPPSVSGGASTRTAPRPAPLGRVGRARDLDADLLHDVDAVVCSALLDVLTEDDLAHLVDVLGEARVPLLAALTVTGEVVLSPGHAEDATASSAVHATATAGGAAGPAALAVLRTAAGRRGSTVVERRTPWLLDPQRDRDLLSAWTDGYVVAALAHEATAPAQLAPLGPWARERLTQVAGSRLTVAVEHVDVLVLPA